MGRGALSLEQQLPPIDRHRIAQGQLPAAPGFDAAVDAHVAALDAQLGLATGAHQALVLEELIEFQGWGRNRRR